MKDFDSCLALGYKGQIQGASHETQSTGSRRNYRRLYWRDELDGSRLSAVWWASEAGARTFGLWTMGEDRGLQPFARRTLAGLRHQPLERHQRTASQKTF